MATKIIPLEKKELPSTCIVFKHSTNCGISADAAEQVRGYSWQTDLYWINVIEQRDLSNWVASTYNVMHESPQLLVIGEGKVAKVLNHREVNKDNFERL